MTVCASCTLPAMTGGGNKNNNCKCKKKECKCKCKCKVKGSCKKGAKTTTGKAK